MMVTVQRFLLDIATALTIAASIINAPTTRCSDAASYPRLSEKVTANTDSRHDKTETVVAGNLAWTIV